MNTHTIVTALGQAVKLADKERTILTGFIERTQNTILELQALQSGEANSPSRLNDRYPDADFSAPHRPTRRHNRRASGIYAKVREVVTGLLTHTMSTKELLAVCREQVPGMANSDLHNVLFLGTQKGLWLRLGNGIYGPNPASKYTQPEPQDQAAAVIRAHSLGARA